MKNILLSVVATIALSSFAMGTGDMSVPVEVEALEVPEEVLVESGKNGFYLSFGYGLMTQDAGDGFIYSYNMAMLGAGYEVNDYLDIEARYWINPTKDEVTNTELGQTTTFERSYNVSSIYLKPKYPISDRLNVYALLGYTYTEFESTVASGNNAGSTLEDGSNYSLGLGVSYQLTSDFSLSMDTLKHNPFDSGNLEDLEHLYTNVNITYHF